MTIERDPPFFFDVVCDDCGTDERIESEDFHDVLRQIKELGWRNIKVGKFWEQHCFECSGAAKEFS